MNDSTREVNQCHRRLVSGPYKLRLCCEASRYFVNLYLAVITIQLVCWLQTIGGKQRGRRDLFGVPQSLVDDPCFRSLLQILLFLVTSINAGGVGLRSDAVMSEMTKLRHSIGEPIAQ